MSTDSTRFILVVTTTTGPSRGTAPPASPVPEPRATNGRPWWRAARTHACTSAVLVGKHTTAAAPSMLEASRRYRPSSVVPACTRDGSRAVRSSATSASCVTSATVDPSQPLPCGVDGRHLPGARLQPAGTRRATARPSDTAARRHASAGGSGRWRSWAMASATAVGG